MTHDVLLTAAADVRDDHTGNEWDSCGRCRLPWPCASRLLAEMVLNRAARTTAARIAQQLRDDPEVARLTEGRVFP